MNEADMQHALIREVGSGPCHHFGHAARVAGLMTAQKVGRWKKDVRGRARFT
jgi:hypothetical protein